MAQEAGMHTTNDVQDIFELDDINTIVKFTKNRQIAKEIKKFRPKHVRVVEPDLAQVFITVLRLNRKLKSAEHQVNTEKIFSDFIFHNTAAAIAVVNTEFKIVDANDAYLKIVNKTKEDVLGSHCYQIHYGLSRPCGSSNPAFRCPMLETLKTGKTAQVIQEYPTSKDLESYCVIVTHPLRNQEGEIVEVMEIWKDVTEELSTTWERRTNALKSDLGKMIQEDRMISLGKLVASCVHEINNPIQGMLTFADLMQQTLEKGTPCPEDLDQFKGFLSLMSRELERCGNIVSGLLSFSRETQLEYKSIDFREVLDAVISLTRHKMMLQDIQLSTDLGPQMMIMQGDTNQLQQVMLNLIFNAIEAMPNGGTLAIRTRLKKKEKVVEIRIQDTGIGISAEALEHVFDPFYSTKEEGKGIGLGLSIVYGIVKNHKGKVHVNSLEGKGTEFVLTFPIS